jgi:predicted permease
MPDFAQPVSMSFIIETIGVIFVIIGVGIALVKKGKKSRNLKG